MQDLQAEVERLKQEIERLNHAAERHRTNAAERLQEIQSLNALLEKCEKALEFYASGWNPEQITQYHTLEKGTTWRPIFSRREDHGTIAAELLAEIREHEDKK